jgi:hypothetical protein
MMFYSTLTGWASLATRPALFHSFTNSFKSRMPWVLRMNAVSSRARGEFFFSGSGRSALLG